LHILIAFVHALKNLAKTNEQHYIVALSSSLAKSTKAFHGFYNNNGMFQVTKENVNM